MARHHLPGSPPVPLILRRSPLARRISLRVSQLDGRVTLTLPRGVDEAEALAFAQSRDGWIRTHLEARPDEIPVRLGAVIPVEGQPRRIRTGQGRRIRLEGTALYAPAGPVGRPLLAWLRALARDRLAAAADRYALTLGKPYERLTLRDTRSRWGSCTSRGGLMFSWRLILAPPEVLRYVAAHEVAHLAEMNHSPAFWATVERIHGPYAEPRHWLRREGTSLHRFRF